MSYVQLHTFTEHSIGTSICNIKEYVLKAKEFQYKHIGIKCKDSLFGALEFHYKCKRADLNPIICTDLNINTVTGNSSAFPITLYVKNEKGWKNLLLLSKADRADGVLDKNFLRSHNAGLIASSAGIHGEIVHLLQSDETEKAKKAAAYYQQLFENFYIELISGTNEESLNLNKTLNEISSQLKIRTLANYSVNFLDKDHLKPFLVSQYLHTGQPYKFVEKEYETYKDCYLHSCDEIKTLFPGEQEAIDNSELLAESCSLEFTEQTPKLPEFKLPSGFTNAEEYLRHLTEIELRKLFPDDEYRPKIQDQIEKELNYVTKKNQSDYLLIISDLIQWARSNNVFVQNTMGVSSGCMLYYILGITQINPNEFNLLFESSLSFSTDSVSTVVLSVDEEGWEPLINYIKNKYGHDHVSNIISYGKRSDPEIIEECAITLGISIQDFGYYDFIKNHKDLWLYISGSGSESVISLLKKKMEITPIKRLRELVTVIGLDENIYWNWLGDYPYTGTSQFIEDFKEYINENNLNVEDSHLELFFKTISVLHRNIKTYECSQNRIGISKDSITSIIPSIKQNSTGIELIEYPIYQNRTVYKFDLLKENFMSVLKNCQMLIQKTDRDFDIQNIPTDDSMSFTFLNSILFTEKCFLIYGFGSIEFQEMLSKVKPSCFEDLIACAALYHHHTIKLIDPYVKGKQSPESVILEHPLLEDILRSTHGVFLYQEQMMNLIHKVSHISLKDINKLRRTLSMNKDNNISKFKNEFILEVNSNGYSKEEASDIFRIICLHSLHLVYKAVSTNRAYLSYQYLYCLAHYPEEFQDAQTWKNK